MRKTHGVAGKSLLAVFALDGVPAAEDCGGNRQGL